MSTRIINFFDGYTTSSAPAQIGIQNLLRYATDAEFETDNADTPVLGNIYYNTTDNKIRYYVSSWKQMSDSDDLQTIIDSVATVQSNLDTTNSNVTDVTNDLSTLETSTNTFIATKGQANGLATLDSTSKIPAANLPSYVDDVLEFANVASFPVSGESDKIYIALDNSKTYRWSGSTYAEISPSDVNSVNGQTGVVTLTKTDVSLGNVTNDSQMKREAGDINTFTEKTIPVADDIVIIEDSEDTFNKKKAKLSTLLGGGGGSSFTGSRMGGPSGASIGAYSTTDLADVFTIDYDVVDDNDVSATAQGFTGTGTNARYVVPEDGYYRMSITIGIQFSNGSQDNYINLKILSTSNTPVADTFLPQTYTSGAFNTTHTLTFEGYLTTGQTLRPQMLVGFPSGTCIFRTQANNEKSYLSVSKIG